MSMPTHENNLRTAVYQLIGELPKGRVTTYGDLAVLAGHPGAARIVGGIAHQGPEGFPWHRLVNARGGLAFGYPGGQDAQRVLLEADGISCDDSYCVVDFERRRWRPEI